MQSFHYLLQHQNEVRNAGILYSPFDFLFLTPAYLGKCLRFCSLWESFIMVMKRQSWKINCHCLCHS